jgi:ABC-type multidrug transport system fused ATPase/permease subunit
LCAYSVDRETNKIMQYLIRSEFANCTVVCVEHHLENILDYDKVTVLDGGCLSEFDSPDVLLQRRSMFRQMLENQ